MAKVSTNIALEPDLKIAAQELFRNLGMDLTTAITIFLKQAVREQSIPFHLTLKHSNEETIAAMREYELMKKHPELYKRYNTFDELMSEVLNDA